MNLKITGEFMVKLISLEDLTGWKRKGIFITLICGIQFIFVTIIAMFFYPRPYNFIMDHFSTLGLLDGNASFGGPALPFLANPISSVMFMITVIVTAVAIIPFWIVMPFVNEERKSTKLMSWGGSIIGLASVPFLMMVAIPADVELFLHAIGALGFFALFAVAIIFYTVALFFNEKYDNRLAIIGLIAIFIGFSYAIIGNFYSFLPPVFAYSNAFHQKIAVYSFIIWALLQIVIIWKDIGEN